MRIGTRLDDRCPARWRAILPAVAALMLVTALSIARVGAVQTAAMASPASAGLKVYADRKCSTCHMIARSGNVRFPLDGVGARLSVEELRRWLTDTAEMERAMPRQPAVRMSEWLESNRTINERDREALVAYLASLK